MSMPRILEKLGSVYGRLTVMSRVGGSVGETKYRCRCTCGEFTNVAGSRLRSGNTRSCGCLHTESIVALGKQQTHGLTGTRIYSIHEGMMRRCYEKTNGDYANYGGRGIGVCRRWHDVAKFFEDMGNPPTKQHQLDRKNNNGNYDKRNCRWVTCKINNNNRRSNDLRTFRGTTMTVTAWAELYRIRPATLRSRLERGWTMKQSLTISTEGRGRKI